jgi:hypothetical protein
MAASNFVFLDHNIGLDSPVATGTVQVWPLGLTAQAKHDTVGLGEFVYVQGSTHAAGMPVILQGGYAKALATAVNNGSAAPVGIAPSAMTGTGVYGWVQVRGIADYAVAAVALAVGNQMLVPVNATSGISTAAAGSVAVALRIMNITPVSSASASTAAGVLALHYPFYPGA